MLYCDIVAAVCTADICENRDLRGHGEDNIHLPFETNVKYAF